jgi:subtilisin family serine protease
MKQLTMLVVTPRLARGMLAGVLAVTAGLTLVPRTAGPQPAGPTPSTVAAASGAVEIHLKLRSETATFGLLATTAPLLHLAADVHDARARWRVTYAAAAEAERAVAVLLADPAVEAAFVAPDITLATTVSEPSAAQRDACPIATPSYESYQGYLAPAPGGIDAAAAWQRGSRGAGVWFADIEGNWNPAHEDLDGKRITHVGGERIDDRGWRAHGTAVLGEVVGVDNGKGVVGIAPDVDRVFTSSIGGTSVADAINAAQMALRPGDVLLIELQGAGPRRNYIAVEYWDDIYDVIRAATDRGVIVIEAAGNGGENLEHKAYGGKFDRKVRDSGAIIVGAGGPARKGFTDRARLDFSNYGARVDVQGWGRGVATLDYGDLQKCNEAGDRHYTDAFSGTSSASPIVAGAAILLQSFARTHGTPMTPAQMRDLLRATGTAQTGNTKQPIGPRPDLARAFARVWPDR